MHFAWHVARLHFPLTRSKFKGHKWCLDFGVVLALAPTSLATVDVLKPGFRRRLRAFVRAFVRAVVADRIAVDAVAIQELIAIQTWQALAIIAVGASLAGLGALVAGENH